MVSEDAEESLIEREERFRAFLTATSDVVYSMSADWSEMRHLDGKNFIANTTDPSRTWLSKYIHPADQKFVMDAFQLAIQEKTPFELEHRVIRPDESVGWIFSRAIPILNAGGQIKEWFGTARDVTEPKRSESLQMEQQHLLELIAARSSVQLCLNELTGAVTRLQPKARAAVLVLNKTQMQFDSIVASDFPQAFVEGLREFLYSAVPAEASLLAAGSSEALSSTNIAGEETWPKHWRKLCLDNGILACHSEPVKGKDGQILGSILMCLMEARRPNDWELRIAQFGSYIASIVITHKQAEEAIAEQRRLYEAILTNTPDLAYVFDLDHRFIYANEGLLRMWGKTWDEAIGRNCLELGYEPWHAEMHDREIDHIAATKQPVRGEVPFAGPLGRRIYDYLLVPVLDADGKVIAVAGTTRDITERKLSEESIRRSEQRQQLVLASMPQKIFTALPDGTLDYFNPQWTAFTGLSSEKPHALDWNQFIHSEEVVLTLHKWRTSIETITPFECEHRFFDNKGEYRWHVTRALPILDEQGKATMWIGSSTDIEDQKQLEVELRTIDRRKDEFLAMLAHELRNPLAPITNAIHLLQLDQESNLMQHEVRDMIERQTTQLTRLVDDLLEVSRITTGRIQLRQNWVTASEVVARAVESVRSMIEQHNHKLMLSVTAEPIWLYADAARLEQVLVNLLNNAAKYTHDGGRIEVDVQWKDGQAQLCVRDNGMGIEAQLLPRVFELFTQAERSLDRSYGGLGVGLSLVKTLVELHGGTVTAHSVVGEGSEFTALLPASITPENKVSSEKEAIPDSVKSASRILVVDDNVDAANTLAKLLRISGNDVCTAYDGLAALDVAHEYQPDVVLLDIGLPKLNGYEVAKQLRGDSRVSGAILIAITGYGQEQDHLQTRMAGFDAHLVKPVNFAHVKSTISDLQKARKGA